MTSQVTEATLPLTSNKEEVTSKVGVKRQTMGGDDLSKSIQKNQKKQKTEKKKKEKKTKKEKTKKSKKEKTKKSKKSEKIEELRNAKLLLNSLEQPSQMITEENKEEVRKEIKRLEKELEDDCDDESDDDCNEEEDEFAGIPWTNAQAYNSDDEEKEQFSCNGCGCSETAEFSDLQEAYDNGWYRSDGADYCNGGCAEKAIEEDDAVNGDDQSNEVYNLVSKDTAFANFEKMVRMFNRDAVLHVTDFSKDALKKLFDGDYGVIEREHEKILLDKCREQAKNDQEIVSIRHASQKPKSVKELIAIAVEYRDNEERNKHVENALLLATNFGTPEEVEEVKACSARLEKSPKEGPLKEDVDWMTKKMNQYFQNIKSIDEKIIREPKEWKPLTKVHVGEFYDPYYQSDGVHVTAKGLKKAHKKGESVDENELNHDDFKTMIRDKVIDCRQFADPCNEDELYFQSVNGYKWCVKSKMWENYGNVFDFLPSLDDCKLMHSLDYYFSIPDFKWKKMVFKPLDEDGYGKDGDFSGVDKETLFDINDPNNRFFAHNNYSWDEDGQNDYSEACWVHKPSRVLEILVEYLSVYPAAKNRDGPMAKMLVNDGIIDIPKNHYQSYLFTSLRRWGCEMNHVKGTKYIFTTKNLFLTLYEQLYELNDLREGMIMIMGDNGSGCTRDDVEFWKGELDEHGIECEIKEEAVPTLYYDNTINKPDANFVNHGISEALKQLGKRCSSNNAGDGPSIINKDDLKTMITAETVKIPENCVLVISDSGITLQEWNGQFKGKNGLYEYIDTQTIQMLPSYNYLKDVDIFCDEIGKYSKGVNKLALELLGHLVHGGTFYGTVCLCLPEALQQLGKRCSSNNAGDGPSMEAMEAFEEVFEMELNEYARVPGKHTYKGVNDAYDTVRRQYFPEFPKVYICISPKIKKGQFVPHYIMPLYHNRRWKYRKSYRVHDDDSLKLGRYRDRISHEGWYGEGLSTLKKNATLHMNWIAIVVALFSSYIKNFKRICEDLEKQQRLYNERRDKMPQVGSLWDGLFANAMKTHDRYFFGRMISRISASVSLCLFLRRKYRGRRTKKLDKEIEKEMFRRTRIRVDAVCDEKISYTVKDGRRFHEMSCPRTEFHKLFVFVSDAQNQLGTKCSSNNAGDGPKRSVEEKLEDTIYVACGTWEPLDPYKKSHSLYFENGGYFWSKDVKHKPVWMRDDVYHGKWVSIVDNVEEFHKQLGKKCSSNNAGDGPKSKQRLRRALGNITNAIENLQKNTTFEESLKNRYEMCSPKAFTNTMILPEALFGRGTKCTSNNAGDGPKRSAEEKLEFVETTTATVEDFMELSFGDNFKAMMQEVKERTVRRPKGKKWPKTEDRPDYYYEIFWNPDEAELERFKKASTKIFEEVTDAAINPYRKKKLINRFDYLLKNDYISCRTNEDARVDYYETGENVEYGEFKLNREYNYVPGNDDYYKTMEEEIEFLTRPDQLKGEKDDDYKVRVMSLLPWKQLQLYDEEGYKEKIIEEREGLLEKLVNCVERQWFATNGWHFSSIGGRGYGMTTLYVPASLMNFKYIDEETNKLTDMLQRDYKENAYFGTGIDDFGDQFYIEDEKPCSNVESDYAEDWEDVDKKKWANIQIASLWIFE